MNRVLTGQNCHNWQNLPSVQEASGPIPRDKTATTARTWQSAAGPDGEHRSQPCCPSGHQRQGTRPVAPCGQQEWTANPWADRIARPRQGPNVAIGWFLPGRFGPVSHGEPSGGFFLFVGSANMRVPGSPACRNRVLDLKTPFWPGSKIRRVETNCV